MINIQHTHVDARSLVIHSSKERTQESCSTKESFHWKGQQSRFGCKLNINPSKERTQEPCSTNESVRSLSVVFRRLAASSPWRWRTQFAAMQMLARRGDVAIVKHNCSRP